MLDPHAHLAFSDHLKLQQTRCDQLKYIENNRDWLNKLIQQQGDTADSAHALIGYLEQLYNMGYDRRRCDQQQLEEIKQSYRGKGRHSWSH